MHSALISLIIIFSIIWTIYLLSQWARIIEVRMLRISSLYSFPQYYFSEWKKINIVSWVFIVLHFIFDAHISKLLNWKRPFHRKRQLWSICTRMRKLLTLSSAFFRSPLIFQTSKWYLHVINPLTPKCEKWQILLCLNTRQFYS